VKAVVNDIVSHDTTRCTAIGILPGLINLRGQCSVILLDGNSIVKRRLLNVVTRLMVSGFELKDADGYVYAIFDTFHQR